jgi:hypothetical protein
VDFLHQFPYQAVPKKDNGRPQTVIWLRLAAIGAQSRTFVGGFLHEKMRPI